MDVLDGNKQSGFSGYNFSHGKYFKYFKYFIWSYEELSLLEVSSYHLELEQYKLMYTIWVMQIKVFANWVRILCTLKNKYNLTLCQSRLHKLSSETSDWFRFSAFSHLSVIAKFLRPISGPHLTLSSGPHATWNDATWAVCSCLAKRRPHFSLENL